MAGKVTQKELARITKVHPSTVCLALRDNPLIAPETRARIFAAAKRFGYERDPMLGALAAYRRTRRAPAFHGVLGWLVHNEKGYFWDRVPHYRSYFEGAKERGLELGYKFEEFGLQDYANLERLSSVLRSRGIRGVLITPQPQPRTLLPLNFENLSAVTFGYTVQSPKLHMVSTNHFASIREVVGELRQRGYRRIGYAIPQVYDERVDKNYRAGFLIESENWPKSERVPFYTQPAKLAPFRNWLKTYHPDSVIISHEIFPEMIKQIGIAMPEKLGVVIPSVVKSHEMYAGVDDDSREIGRVATAFLASLVERGERGIPRRPQRVLVRGIWNEGQTLRSA